MGKKIIPTEIQLAKINEMAGKGCAITHIAEEVLIDRSAIKRILTEYKIELKQSASNNKGKKYEWTKEREDKLKAMYEDAKIKLDDIVDEFKISEGAIVKKAKELRISKKRDFYEWSSHKLRKLKELYNDKDLTMPNIAELMETTEAVIRNKAKEQRLVKAETDLFSIDDINYIKRNKDVKTETEIAEHLGRSLVSIRLQLSKAGIAVYHSRRIEMPDTEEFRKDIGDPMMSGAVLARKYKVGAGVITRWRKELFGTFKTMIDTWRCKTTAEIEFEEILEELDLAYIFHKEILGWTTDFYLGSKTIVEVYSSYHHKLDKVAKKDERAIKELSEAGYKVITVWDYELKHREEIKHKILANFRGLPS